MLIGSAPGALLWPAAMIVWGPGAASSGHSHHCVQLLVALDGTLQVRASAAQPWLACPAVLIPPDTPHEVQAEGVPILIAFVEAESVLGAGMLSLGGEEIALVPEEQVRQWRERLQPRDTLPPLAVEQWLRASFPTPARPSVHPGVNRAIHFLREGLPDSAGAPVEELARVAGLSASRFMHVFQESIGVAVRPFILWLRVQCACGALAQGATATRAAHAAGFSDAAHMTRTFRRMLGSTPSELIQRAPRTRTAALAPHEPHHSQE